jgi:hypothetical protein
MPILLVDKVTKDYGACKVQPASALNRRNLRGHGVSFQPSSQMNRGEK